MASSSLPTRHQLLQSHEHKPPNQRCQQFVSEKTRSSTSGLALMSLLMSLLMTSSAHAPATGGEHPCTYDFQLQTSTMRVSCPGSPATVNVFAESATLQTKSLPDAAESSTSQPSQERNNTTGTSGRSEHRGWSYRQKMGQDRTDLFASHVWNASRRLDETRRSITGYTSSLEGMSVRLAEGRLTLESDMDKLKRETETPDGEWRYLAGCLK